MEELIGQFYPGLFSLTPPVAGSSNQVLEKTMFGPVALNSGSAEIPPSLQDLNDAGHPKEGNTSLWRGELLQAESDDYRDSYRMSHLPHLRKQSTGCCETITEYVTPPNVTIQGKVYRVVHLRRAFQFIPIGRCRFGTTCSYGECVDQYRAHWVLVYNHSDTNQGPPVSFSPIEVSSHCECMNVGRP